MSKQNNIKQYYINKHIEKRKQEAKSAVKEIRENKEYNL